MQKLLDSTAFAERMAIFAPFEPEPLLAVAVSGGRDSLALALLASGWAKERGGRVLALTVDHGLRPESAGEAQQAASWLAARGIATEILAWHPPADQSTAVQARARAARYRLLADRCAALGILHLLLAHQADDQAETFILRLLRDSGFEGLAGMAACVELPEVRLLRPLLDVPREALARLLGQAGQPWIDDPSNDNPAYARAALRRSGLPVAAAAVAGAGQAMARLRDALEQRVAAILAASAEIHPLGAVLLAPVLGGMPLRLAMAVMARAVMTAGGRDYPPRSARLRRIVAAMQAAETSAAAGRRDSTLAGCRILWRQGQWVIARDSAAIGQGAAAAKFLWDGRFRLESPEQPAALGPAGWLRHRTALARRFDVPGLPVIAAALPASHDTAACCGEDGDRAAFPVFRPLRPLVPAPFFPCFAGPARQMLV